MTIWQALLRAVAVILAAVSSAMVIVGACWAAPAIGLAFIIL